MRHTTRLNVSLRSRGPTAPSLRAGTSSPATAGTCRRPCWPGFKIAFSRESDDIATLTHGVHVVLVDGRGRIRGYYDSNDAEALERLVNDARRLADRPSS